MANKFLDENGLAHLWSKITSKFVTKSELQESADKKLEPFMITCKADFVSNVLTNVSHTFAQISEVYERGDHIYIECDLSQMAEGRKVLLNLVIFQPNDYVAFENVISGNGYPHIRGEINADNTNGFFVTNLVPQTQISNLKFVVSSSVPTVDDRSVITFVIEG